MANKIAKIITLFLGLVCLYSFCVKPDTRKLGTDSAQAKVETSVAVFPDAMGFGTISPAGSGRHLRLPNTLVIRISNLNADGPGSLRACIANKQPRTCVFEVSGVINLSKPLVVSSPYLTIAGQTAPDPGVMIRGAGIIVKSHDVLVQHLEIRIGDDLGGENPTSRDGITILGKSESYNVTVDHVSVSWAIDENVSTWYPNLHDVTFSNCIFAEGLQNSIHPKGPHSKGLLIGSESQRLSLIRNVFAHNVERNPQIKTDTSAEMINNIVYGWGGKSHASIVNLSDSDGSEEPLMLDLIGNVFKPSPDSSSKHHVVYAKPVSLQTRLFVFDNIVFSAPTSELHRLTESDWALVGFDEQIHRLETRVFPDSQVEILPANQAFEFVLENAGSRPARRNSVDARIIADVRSGTGSYKDCVAGCERGAGGWPEYQVNRREFILPPNFLKVDKLSGLTALEQKLADMSREIEAVIAD